MSADLPRLHSICIESGADASQSLTLAVEAIFRAYEHPVSRVDIAATLGNLFMTTYAAEAPADRTWNTLGLHAFLEPAARVFGLDLRDLHPPEAAPPPPVPHEFDLHFRDSYLPFVAASLTRDEPVLAWAGWPPPNQEIWGIISAIDNASSTPAGHTMYSQGRPVPLLGSPTQAYTIQELRPLQPAPRELLSLVLNHAADVLNNQLPSKFGARTGAAALIAWKDAITTTNDDTTAARLTSRLATCMSSGRGAALELFARLRPDSATDQAAAMDKLAPLFRKMIGYLAPLANAAEYSPSETGAFDREAVSQTITPLITLEEKAAAILSAYTNKSGDNR